MNSYKVIAQFSNVAIRVPELGAPWRAGSVNNGQVKQFGNSLDSAVIDGLKNEGEIFFQTGQPLKNKIILNKFFYFNFLDELEDLDEVIYSLEVAQLSVSDLIEDFGKTINARIEVFETYVPSKKASFISINIFKENGIPTHELKIHDDPRNESSFEILGSGQFLNIVPIKIKVKVVA